MFSDNFLEILGHHEFDAGNKIGGFSIESSLPWMKLSNKTLLVESKTGVREMYESENRQKWKKSKNFRLLEVCAFQCGKLDKLNAIRIFF